MGCPREVLLIGISAAANGGGGGGGPPGPGAFDPLTLTPVIYYDPYVISTLWKDTAGTDPVTASGDLVARINDRSGNGYNLTQATAGNRPTYQVSGNLKWIQFDGGDYMDATHPSIAQPDTIYVAYKQTATTNMTLFDGSVRQHIFASGGGNVLYYAGSSSINSGFAQSTSAVVDGVVFDGASSTYRRNATAGTGGNPGTSALQNIRVGENFGGSAITGNIYGFFIKAGTLTTPQRTDLETQLGSMAGIVI